VFSGIVEGRCKVKKIDKYPRGWRVSFEFEEDVDLNPGQSLSVDGVCLTVEEYENKVARFFLSDETLNKTKFGKVLCEGYVCNYERGLKVGSRIDGHFVLGHVDGVGEMVEIEDYGEDGWEVWVKIPESLEVYLSPKGSIALDGVSLTINEVRGNLISIRLIPHTLRITSLGLRKKGDLLNVEVDVIARYVVSYLEKYGKG